MRILLLEFSLTLFLCCFSVEYHAYFLNSDDLEELKHSKDYERIENSVNSLASLHAHRLLAFAKQHSPEHQSEVRSTKSGPDLR